WNLEGGSITDLSSNSSPSYFNFDSFEQIQVTTGGGDVSVQSGGVSVNLVTKSGSNVFKGTALATFENDTMQANNVTPELFNSGGTGPSCGHPAQEAHDPLGGVGRPDHAQPPLVLGRGRSSGHQRRRRELLRREQGPVLRAAHRCPEAEQPRGRGDLRQ